MTTQIRVTPQQLRQAADQLDTASRNIETAVSSTKQTIERLHSANYFEGNRASVLSGRFQQVSNTMIVWPQNLKQFATLLRDAAAIFEQADNISGNAATSTPSTTHTLKPLDNTYPYNLSDDKLQEAIANQKASMVDQWKKIKDSLAHGTINSVGTILSALATAETVVGLPVAIELGKEAANNFYDVKNALDEIQKARQEFINLQGVASERSMSMNFDTQAELDQQRAVWEKLQADGIQSRTDIIQSFSQGSNNFVEQAVLTMFPVARVAGMAATYDTYFDTWISNEMNMATAEAHLNAINIRQGRL